MTNLDAGARNSAIFGIIVSHYIDTAEPVGSKLVAERLGGALSSASVRNVMADLEEQGLIHQPHTSAGRVPTDKGYRYYVDYLMQPEELSEDEKVWMSQELSKARSIEAVAEKATRVISDLTGNAALLYFKNLRRVSFLNYLLDEVVEMRKLNDFFEEDDALFVEGVRRVFEQPEFFQDVVKFKHLLELLDDEEDLIQIFSQGLQEVTPAMHITIGHENESLDNVSVVSKDYWVRNIPIGSIAVLGPTRMRYPKVISVVDYATRAMSHAIEEF